MSIGNVKWFNKKKGYGFVEYEGSDVFIHHSEIKDSHTLENNELISFEVINGAKGLKAKNIIRDKKNN